MSPSTAWSVFFFNDTATTEIYTLSLHDALPIYFHPVSQRPARGLEETKSSCRLDRKSTRLNSSHLGISYAVFCLKKIKNDGSDNWMGRLRGPLPVPWAPVALG